MISFALLCDAAIGNVQEKMMNAYNVTSTEVVLYSYSLGFIYLFVLLMLSREFFSGFYFCLHVSLLLLIILFIFYLQITQCNYKVTLLHE